MVLKAQKAQISGRVSHDNEPLKGATITLEGTNIGYITDTDGQFLLKNIQAGTYTLKTTFLGFEDFEREILLKHNSDSVFVEIEMHEDEHGHETPDVVVTATRSARNIDDVPIRVEAVPQEEIEEKILMRASSVSMLLSELTGMRLQTTSAASNTANVRIQGLNGRYTQVLTDGIPNFSGMSSGFSIVQTPPLNLRQVEVVKGTASVLYGADAIAGVVNFITKNPTERHEVSALINQTSILGTDISGYYGFKPTENFGFTILSNYNFQKEFDADGDDMTDVAGYNRSSFFPKISYNFSKDLTTTLNFGYTREQRNGGSISKIDNAYTESNTSQRLNGSLRTDWVLSENSLAIVNLAGMQLERDADFGGYLFNATQRLFYSDAQYTLNTGNNELLIGAALNVDDLNDRTPQQNDNRDPLTYRFSDVGIFAQDEFKITEQWTTLLSGRVDFHNVYGTFFSPRASLMYKPLREFTFRVSGGTGFKASTPFVEEAEERGFRRLFIEPGGLKAEKARNAQFDVNWRTNFDEIGINMNALAFATMIDDAVYAHTHSGPGALSIVHVKNVSGPTFTRGGEVSGHITYSDFKFVLGYTYIYATQEHETTPGNIERYEIALNPRHTGQFIIMYENHEEGIKAGFENFYTGFQRLEDNGRFGERSKPYWITGAMIEKAFGNFRIFINFENIFDTRQTRFQRTSIHDSRSGIYQPLPIFAPLEGRVINGGIRFVL